MSDEIMKEYLGDAVYVHHDGFQVWLTTGDSQHQRIALEPGVWNSLLDWHKRAMKHAEELRNGG